MLPPDAVQAVMALAFAGPSFQMGLRLAAVWRTPMAVENGRWVQRGIGIFVLEFILLNTGIMFGTAAVATGASDRMPLGTMLGLTAIFGLFAAAIALAFRSGTLLLSFLWLVAGRLVAVLFGVSSGDQQLLFAHAIVGSGLYFAMVIASVLLPWPRGGITAQVAADTRAPATSGLWVEQPHRAIGPATVYFLLLGVAEVALMTWVDPRAIIPD